MRQGKLPKEVIEKIGEKLGSPIQYPSDCERLSADIGSRLNEIIGVTTLKRLFGFVNDVKVPRQITLDILARYAGYDSYDVMIDELGVKGDSGFEDEPDVDSATLNHGDRVVFTYLPDRKVTTEYLGNLRFRITESLGSSLRAGDIAVISSFSLYQPLKMESVIRDGEDLGRYVAGKVSGLTSVAVAVVGAGPNPSLIL